MAKVNISFNNKNFEIEESALSSATAALKSHLSTVMSGSGSVIDFDGISYNIDSTKLTDATNDFVSHLGTISGSGSNVVVGGIQYGIDSTKLSDVIAEFHTVLGDLQSGDEGSSDETVIFEQQTLTFESSAVELIPAPFTLIEGETYIVVWDGVRHECVCVPDTIQDTGLPSITDMVIADNGDIVSGSFILVYGSQEAMGSDDDTIMIMSVCGLGDHTVSVYKIEDNGNGELTPNIAWEEKYISADGTITIAFFEVGKAIYTNEAIRELWEVKYVVNTDGTTSILCLQNGTYVDDGIYVTADGKTCNNIWGTYLVLDEDGGRPDNPFI